MAVRSQMFSPNVFLIHVQTIPEVANFFFGGGSGGGVEISLLEFVSKQLVLKQTGIKMTGFPLTKYILNSLWELWQLQMYIQRKRKFSLQTIMIVQCLTIVS